MTKAKKSAENTKKAQNEKVQNSNEQQANQVSPEVAAAMQKMLTGQPLTPEELELIEGKAKTIRQAVRKATRNAEQKAKQKEAEAVYERELQQHKIDIQAWVEGFANNLLEAVKAKDGVKTASDLKSLVKDELKDIPKEPRLSKRGTVTRSGGNGGGSRKKGGVLDTIATTIEEAGEEGVTKDEILEVLIEKFPERDKDSMKVTLNAQVPTRISAKRFKVERHEETGKYFKAE